MSHNSHNQFVNYSESFIKISSNEENISLIDNNSVEGQQPNDAKTDKKSPEKSNFQSDKFNSNIDNSQKFSINNDHEYLNRKKDVDKDRNNRETHEQLSVTRKRNSHARNDGSSDSSKYSRRRRRSSSTSSRGSIDYRRSRRTKHSSSSDSNRSPILESRYRRRRRRKSYSSSPSKYRRSRNNRSHSNSPVNRSHYKDIGNNSSNKSKNQLDPILVIPKVPHKVSEKIIIENLIKHGPTPLSVKFEPSSTESTNNIFIEYEDFSVCRIVLRSTKETLLVAGLSLSVLTLHEFKLKSEGRQIASLGAFEKPMSSEPPSSVLIFRSLDYIVTEDNIRDIVNKLSPVPILDVRLIKDRQTGTSRGFCFVELKTVQDATLLLNTLKGMRPPFRIGNRRIVVDFAKMDTYSSNGLSNVLPGPAGLGSNSDSVANLTTNIGMQSVVANAIAAATGLNKTSNVDMQSVVDNSVADAANLYYSNQNYAVMPPIQTAFYPNNQYQSNTVQPNPYLFQCEPNSMNNNITLPPLQAISNDLNHNYDNSLIALNSTAPSATSFEASCFQYDSNTGYYFDPVSKYFYNPNTCQYLRYNDETKNWDIIPCFQPQPIQSGLNDNDSSLSLNPKSTSNETEKDATSIAKDMERWAKKQKQKKASSGFKPIVNNIDNSNNKSTEPDFCYHNNKLIVVKNHCLLCLRTFQDEEYLKLHLEFSEFHKSNLLKLSNSS